MESVIYKCTVCEEKCELTMQLQSEIPFDQCVLGSPKYPQNSYIAEWKEYIKT
jgi:hypothetical protein